MSRAYDHYDDDDRSSSRGQRWYEFECPGCDAHNPYEAGFGVGYEVLCYYCGIHYNVIERDGGFKLKEA